MTVTMESSEFVGKNYLSNRNSVGNTTNLTQKQMFNISAKLVSEQEEISGLETIGWENHSWKYLFLILFKKESSIFNAQRSTSFLILCCILVRYTRTFHRTMDGNKDWVGYNLLKISETLTESTASQWNLSGIFSQHSIRCSSVKKLNVYF